MTDAEKKPAADEMSLATTARFPGRRRFPLAAVLLPLIIILGFYSGFMILRLHGPAGATVAPDTTAVVVQLEQRVASDEQKIQDLESKLDDLTAHAPAPPATAPSAAETQNSAQMQGDLASLASEVAALGAALKQAGNAAAETWQATQSMLAANVAFGQLRADADAGRGFAADLTALRVATTGDAALQGPLAQLDPYAAKGVATVSALRTEFEGLEGPVSVAIDKATAQGWREKLLAELKGLISIRPLHGAPAADALATTEAALDAGDLASALAAVKQLPPEAQDVLKDWRTKAETRLNVDHTLATIADRLATPPPSARNTP